VLQKTAQLYAADVVGREYADDLVINQMAKRAGALMAQRATQEDTQEAKVKLASAMLVGDITHQDYREITKLAGLYNTGQIDDDELEEMLKEAGIGTLFKGLGKGLFKGVRRAATGTARGARSATSGVLRRARMPRLAGRVAPAPRAATRVSGRAASKARKARQAAIPQAAKAKQVGAEMQKQVSQAQLPKGPIQVGNVPKGAPPPGRVTPAQTGQGGPYRTPAAPAQQAAAPAASTGTRTVTSAPAASKGTTSAPPTKGKGILPFMWRNRAPLALGGAALGMYGVGKGAQFAARQLEQTSTTPQSQGTPGGWSPVNYGYGNNPYGNQQAMGYGA